MKIKTNIKTLPLLLLTLLIATGCSKWTEPKAIEVDHSTIDKQNPELYAEYLKNLRTYKATDHKIVLAWFDNLNYDTYSSRGQHLSEIPDSVDMVILKNPRELNEQLLKEKELLLKDKATKTLSFTGYDQIIRSYTSTGEVSGAGLTDYINRQTKMSLILADEYSFDGMIVKYEGKSMEAMEPEELEEYIRTQEAFLEPVKDWSKSNPDKILILEGNPSYIYDKSFLSDCSFILISTNTAKSQGEFTTFVRKTIETGVPTDRFLISAETQTSNPYDLTTGYISDNNGNKMSAIIGAAYWTVMPDSWFTKAGIAILELQRDYYSLGKEYHFTREAISIMNPNSQK